MKKLILLILFIVTTITLSADAERYFRKADLNNDTELSFEELKDFQVALYNHYDYIENSTALSPDEFFSAGGGDCEDWAIVISSLLDFWGFEAYVGIVPGANSLYQHAVALVGVDELLPGEIGFHFNGYFLLPLDYDLSGQLSSAAGEARLLKFYPPQLLIGKEM